MRQEHTHLSESHKQKILQHTIILQFHIYLKGARLVETKTSEMRNESLHIDFFYQTYCVGESEVLDMSEEAFVLITLKTPVTQIPLILYTPLC